MILKDVTVRYCKLNPARPDRKMVPEGKWSLQMYTRDKAQSQAWRDAKIKVKLQEDDQGIIYTSNLSKKAVKAVKNSDGKKLTIYAFCLTILLFLTHFLIKLYESIHGNE